MYETERFRNQKLAIDISNATELEQDLLNEYFISNELFAPYNHRDNYVKNSRSEGWVLIFYDDLGLNAHMESARNWMHKHYDVITVTEFLKCVDSPLEIQEDEFADLF